MPTLLRIHSARRVLTRAVMFTLLSFAALAVALQPVVAQNIPRAYAGIVVDAKTGQVLYQDKANDLRFPASLTKVMTLYILFQELEAGRMQLNTRLSVSAHAAAAVPTKLYVQRGSTITVENAIKALVTLSANDVARVVAENISGTESRFADRMTQTARALGMSKTTYKNASGLPNSAQVTTAADQAVLARAVFQHFPHYYQYFQTRSFTYGSKTYGNHNALLGQNGVDGIKTGYINASGYNLMTAARQNNRHIVVVALGFNTGASRNAKVAELVRTYMPKARQGDYWREAMIARPALLGTGTAVAAAPAGAVPLGGLPPARPAGFGAPVQVASVAPQAAPVPAPAPQPAQPETIPFQIVSAADIPSRPGDSALDQATYVATGVMPSATPVDDPIGAWIAETMRLSASPSDVGTLQPGQVLVPPAPIARPQGLTVDLMTTQSTANAAQAGGWIVQIGAAPTPEGASALISEATTTIAALADLRPYVETFERNGQTYYRARFAGFADRNQARATCDALTEASMSCLAVQG